jgi:hypothetical protein
MKHLPELIKGEYRGWKQFHPAPVAVALDFDVKPRREQPPAFDMAMAAGDVDLKPPVAEPVPVTAISPPGLAESIVASMPHPWFPSIIFLGSGQYPKLGTPRTKLPLRGPVMIREYEMIDVMV